MIKKDDIINGFDNYAKAKKQNVLALKLSLIFAGVVVVCVLFWGFTVFKTALNQVLVIERSGEYVKFSADNNERLFQTLIKSTCEKVTHYANSFDRISLRENQAKAAFYANKEMLQRIFIKYQSDASYHDALENGTQYVCDLEEVQEIKGDNTPFEVSFTSMLSVYYNNNVNRYRIYSSGKLIKTTIQYPDNVTGFTFSELTQRVEKIQ